MAREATLEPVSIERSAPAWLADLEGGPDEVLWNLRGLLRGWDEYPEWMDFEAPDSPNYQFKALQTQLYREQIGDLLRSDRPLRVLDAACGIGRWAVPLAAAGHDVVAVDACLPSLAAAERYAARQGVGDRLRLVHADVDSYDFGDGFDLVLALELLCYLPDASATARRLSRALTSGGHLVASVEAWPGGLLADPSGLSLGAVATALETHILSVPDDRWVRLLAGDELAAILRQAGLDVVRSTGLLRVLDGPLMSAVDVTQLQSPAYRDALLGLEASLGAEPGLANLTRAVLAVGRLS